MPVMTLMLLASVFPFRFPFLDFCFRHRDYMLRKCSKFGKRRSGSLIGFHRIGHASWRQIVNLTAFGIHKKRYCVDAIIFSGVTLSPGYDFAISGFEMPIPLVGFSGFPDFIF